VRGEVRSIAPDSFNPFRRHVHSVLMQDEALVPERDLRVDDFEEELRLALGKDLESRLARRGDDYLKRCRPDIRRDDDDPMTIGVVSGVLMTIGSSHES
jgi:hypothetical protein